MDVNRIYNYAHMDKFGRADKERGKKEGAEARVTGKRPNEGSSEGTGCLLYTSDAADE